MGWNNPPNPKSDPFPIHSTFAEDIDQPNGYFIEALTEEDELKVGCISNGVEFSVFIGRNRTHDSFVPIVANAFLHFSQKLEQTEAILQENRQLKEQLALAKQQQFGTSSEQKPLPEQDMPAPIEEQALKRQKPKLKLMSNAGRKPLPDHLPRDPVVHALDHDQRGCPCCGKTMRELGEEITEQVTVIPAQYRVKKHTRIKYSCSDCGNIISAPMPKSMVPGSSYASPEFLSHIATSKYQLGLPFYRQEAVFTQSGLPFNRTTMANLMNKCADQLTPILQLLKDELLSQNIIHADETTMQVLKEAGRDAKSQSYIWHFRSAASAAHQVVLYDYQETRSGKHPKDFLAGFNGYMHVDGYSGYNNIPNVVRVGCMAHVRRKFVEAVKVLPEGYEDHSLGNQAIDLIGQLYGIERKLEKSPPNIKFEVRQRESIPLLLKVKKWLDDFKPKVLPKSALGKAIHYAVEQWPAVSRYVDSGELAIDNNIAEREIKQLVIGRKNWLFADSKDGAFTNAAMYSLVQTAKANGLNPYDYFMEVFSRLPNLTTSEEVSQLLPWNLKINPERKAA